MSATFCRTQTGIESGFDLNESYHVAPSLFWECVVDLNSACWSHVEIASILSGEARAAILAEDTLYRLAQTPEVNSVVWVPEWESYALIVSVDWSEVVCQAYDRSGKPTLRGAIDPRLLIAAD